MQFHPEIKAPEDFLPREWQDKAFTKWEQYINSDSPTMFLAAVCPAAGKTKWAIMVAVYAFKNDLIDRLVVVVPTSALKEDWADELAAFGIQVDPDWRNALRENYETADGEWHGLAVTYQAAINDTALHCAMCGSKRTMVIFDEVHHCGDNALWGPRVREAFEPAVIKLGLSGTPFRRKGAIPWVEYDDDGVSKAHVSYSHGAAIEDGANIPVAFPSVDGLTEWSENGKTFSVWLSDDAATLKQQSRRRNIAIDPNFGWIERVIKDADEKIDACRQTGDPTAGLIIFAKDRPHARELERKYTEITGYSAVRVTGEMTDAKTRLDAFRNGSQRCLVCVEMVSEGIDIPRLRAAIYATNKREDLGFNQKVGRVVRVNTELAPEVVQLAYFYIPDEPELIAKAERIKEMRDHVLEEEEITCPPPDDDDDDTRDPPRLWEWDALGATGEHSGLIYDGDRIRQQCYARAQVMLQEDQD
ncbi:MAG: DEAD/DEAH box helicase family protein, partial [Chloroflexota bacterium]|nr:DEAD/DEAH box helicase family protein [Chloroflexota bacterium]